MHALFCLYYVVIYEFKYESKMLKPSRLVLAGRDRIGIKTTLLDSLRSQNIHFRARFRQTSYRDLVFARGEFLSVVGDQNESLRLIIIYYIKLHI